jgi:hypothetical protein
MQYLLLIYEDEKNWAKMTEAEKGRVISEYGQLTDDLKKSDRYVGGNPLQPISTAARSTSMPRCMLSESGSSAPVRELALASAAHHHRQRLADQGEVLR